MGGNACIFLPLDGMEESKGVDGRQMKPSTLTTGVNVCASVDQIVKHPTTSLWPYSFLWWLS
jgi:hypothetical protein